MKLSSLSDRSKHLESKANSLRDTLNEIKSKVSKRSIDIPHSVNLYSSSVRQHLKSDHSPVNKQLCVTNSSSFINATQPSKLSDDVCLLLKRVESQERTIDELMDIVLTLQDKVKDNVIKHQGLSLEMVSLREESNHMKDLISVCIPSKDNSGNHIYSSPVCCETASFGSPNSPNHHSTFKENKVTACAPNSVEVQTNIILTSSVNSGTQCEQQDFSPRATTVSHNIQTKLPFSVNTKTEVDNLSSISNLNFAEKKIIPFDPSSQSNASTTIPTTINEVTFQRDQVYHNQIQLSALNFNNSSSYSCEGVNSLVEDKNRNYIGKADEGQSNPKQRLSFMMLEKAQHQQNEDLLIHHNIYSSPEKKTSKLDDDEEEAVSMFMTATNTSVRSANNSSMRNICFNSKHFEESNNYIINKTNNEILRPTSNQFHHPNIPVQNDNDAASATYCEQHFDTLHSFNKSPLKYVSNQVDANYPNISENYSSQHVVNRFDNHHNTPIYSPNNSRNRLLSQSTEASFFRSQLPSIYPSSSAPSIAKVDDFQSFEKSNNEIVQRQFGLSSGNSCSVDLPRKPSLDSQNYLSNFDHESLINFNSHGPETHNKQKSLSNMNFRHNENLSNVSKFCTDESLNRGFETDLYNGHKETDFFGQNTEGHNEFSSDQIDRIMTLKVIKQSQNDKFNAFTTNQAIKIKTMEPDSESMIEFLQNHSQLEPRQVKSFDSNTLRKPQLSSNSSKSNHQVESSTRGTVLKPKKDNSIMNLNQSLSTEKTLNSSTATVFQNVTTNKIPQQTMEGNRSKWESLIQSNGNPVLIKKSQSDQWWEQTSPPNEHQTPKTEVKTPTKDHSIDFAKTLGANGLKSLERLGILNHAMTLVNGL